MSISKKQAQRVYDECVKIGADKLMFESFGITIERIEKTIKKSVITSGLSEKRAADALILFWKTQYLTINESRD